MTSLAFVVVAVVGGPLSVLQATGQGEIVAAGAMLLIGIPMFLWCAKRAYLENWNVESHRSHLRKTRPLRYYVGKSVRGLVIMMVMAIATIDLTIFGGDPAVVIKLTVFLLVMASMVSVFASSMLAGAGDVLRA